jgi:hypothetical protein
VAEQEYLFSPSESAGDIAQFVFDNWPPEWEEEAVGSNNFCLGQILLRISVLKFDKKFGFSK